MLPNEENTVDVDEEKVLAKFDAVVASVEPKPIVKATDTLPAAHTIEFVSKRGEKWLTKLITINTRR